MSFPMSPGSRSLPVSSSFATRTCLRRAPNGSALPMLTISGLTDSPLLRPAELLASLPEAFTPELSTDRSPSPLPGMTTVATGQFPPAGLSPAGPAASVAAPRTRLRMMLTSPRSPLSFRTAGFPQYGWKAGLWGGAFPECCQLKPAPGMRHPTSGLLPPFVHLVIATIFPY